MDCKEKQDFLEATTLFKVWKKTHEDAYLVHFLWIGTDDLCIGYYEPKEDTITTFHCGTVITQTADAEIFKEGETVSALSINNITISCEHAKEIAERQRKQNYPQDSPTKEIIVLQTLMHKPMYNINIVTNTCKLFSIRINAETGIVEEEKISPLMDFTETIEKNKKKG